MTLNEWLLSLPEEEQAMLAEDKWMLANRAWDAALTTTATPVAKLHCSDGLSDNRELRKLLWLTHGCISLYGDDGELQCNCGPHKPIDFKRDSVEDIKTKLLKIGR